MKYKIIKILKVILAMTIYWILDHFDGRTSYLEIVYIHNHLVECGIMC